MEERSNNSKKFEEIWRCLRRDGVLVPDMEDFSLTKFRKQVKDISLTEVGTDTNQNNIRILGSRVREFSANSLKDMNANDLLDEEAKIKAYNTQLAQHDHPFGRVTIQRFTFEGNIDLDIEVTIFPIWGTKGERLLLQHLLPLTVPSSLRIGGRKVVKLFVREEHLIDIGAGTP